MGLDMYLKVKKYFWNMGEDKELQEIVSTLFGHKEIGKPDSITFDFMYWRKANHIHKWFVDNVQDGVDDCREYDVETEKLKELLELIKTILAVKDKKKRIEKAKELLPPQQGFFFGSSDTDKYYFDTLVETQEKLETIFTQPELFEDLYFKYQSSW